ncbi:MAG: HWE histidine kinase domain-containing protein [Janthinobacterium lividum]
MPLSDASFPDLAAAVQRVAALEAENAMLRQSLAEAELGSRRMLHELRHRTRNTLAVVRSIAYRTAKTSDTIDDYAMHLTGRLDAVARAETLISYDPQGGACLDSLLLEELLAHAIAEGDQVSLSGPLVRLRGKAVETLALAIHELTVNAVEHGALSTREGRITVTWRIEPALLEGENVGRTQAGRVLRLEWRETSNFLSDVSARPRGFGMEMIERTLPYDLGAEVSLRFDSAGVCCDVAVPLTDEIVEAGPCL